jgi:ketosteroid isomerase-like protein
VSAENVELVRRMMREYEAGDYDHWTTVVTPDVVWDLTGSDLPEAPVLRGHDEVREWFRRWLGAWEEYRQESVEFIDAGDSVVVVFRQRGRGKGSGAYTEAEFYGVYDVRDGKVVRYRHFMTREEAFEAAGL